MVLPDWPKHDAIKKWLRRKNFTILLFLALYALAKVALYVNDNVRQLMPREALVILSGLPAVFITLFFANIIIRIVSPFISRYFRDELEPEQRIFFAKAFEILVYTCAVAFILYSFGVTMSSLALIIGFISGGLAFAVREPVLSFIMWLVVLNKKPFRLGDTVRIGAFEGKVERIGTFYITLDPGTRATDDNRSARTGVKIPNRILIETPIENFGHGDMTQVVRLHLRARPASIERLIADVKRTAQQVLKKEELEPHVDAVFDVQNIPQSDKHYIVLSFSCPVSRRDAVRARMLIAICEKHKRLLMQK